MFPQFGAWPEIAQLAENITDAAKTIALTDIVSLLAAEDIRVAQSFQILGCPVVVCIYAYLMIDGVIYFDGQQYD
jgi:hypothetical protein